MSRTANCLILSLLIFAPHAFAGPDNDKCQKSSQQNAQQCKQTADAANAANSSQAAAAGNAAGTNMKPNAGAMQQVTSDSQSRLQQAAQQCKQNQQQCDQDCDQAKQSADQKAAQSPCTGTCPPAKQDQSQIPQTKQGQCDGAIAPILAQLGSGAAGNQAGNQGAGQTGAAVPALPIPPPSPSSDPAATSSAVGVATLSPTTTCTASDPTAATNSACQDTMLAQCGPGGTMVGVANSPCAQFTANYCTGQGGTQFPTATPPPGSVTPGSGAGTPYCNTAGTVGVGTNSQTTTVTTGTGDTMLPSSSTSSGSGGSGSGSGGGGSGLPSTSAASLGATKDGAAAKASASGLPNINMAVSEGGGGGMSALDEYGGAHDYSLGKFAGFAVDQKKNAAAILGSSRAPASTEVAAVNSPSLFNISSAAIQNMCSHNKLKHCGKN